ncbi:MAG TPA: phosphoribosylamine--glycine ligase [Acidimicrobiales bacterium]|nr:phosphoribosylamine--glycine ligase [Acidimicrobiales bacterium]
MRVCVIGGGAREHVLAHVLSRTAEVVTTPGNPGIEGSVATRPEEIDADLYVIGPEAPLVEGLAHRLRAQGRTVLGPGSDGAQLEGSKAWMKEFATRHGIPTAAHRVFTDAELAVAALRDSRGPWVIKTDGLAAGKGVLVTDSIAEAEEDVRAKLGGESFGDAGRRIVVEGYLDGPEISVLALCDGKRAVALAPAQDFKRVGDGDSGPNTGGMGAYSPVPFVTKDLLDEIEETFLRRAIDGMVADGIDYRGILYAGLALTSNGPRLVEFNIRLGDPEAEVVLPRFESDLAALLHQAASGHIEEEPRFVDDAAVVVVAASAGYPGAVATGRPIHGIEQAEAVDGVTVFHAGTERSRDGQLVSAGGRVLAVTGVGADLAAARSRAYDGMSRITFEGMQYRRDIAARYAGPESGPASESLE